ncbi:unnamed protein product [Oppiella nova]|uniref:TTI1 C-terminal TPR domain-containing protein n=1 Tax=Oppiella nova TaxID=334625 RepID=A0A7R9MNE9_9ACAR|nr:unnamed protein product [Oppiella nova]CAG2180431.1 unnamed protein product [Oppiella nova]
MQVLYSFVFTLNYYFVPNVESDGKQVIACNQRTSSETSAQNFIKLFEDFVENKTISQDFENENEDTISDNEEECDDKENTTGHEKKKVPFYVPLIEKICDRCVHIISNIDPKVRLIVLDIVVQCLRILKPFEDHLLPMAHKLWSPLVERFTDKDVIVTKRSFACLQVMSEICGDFIRVRTLKEVIPKILAFLRSQALISFKKDKASAYRFTIAYQFQIDILCGIGSIAVNLGLRDKDLWPLIVEIMPYLHTYQPLPLQESAINALKEISKLDANSFR